MGIWQQSGRNLFLTVFIMAGCAGAVRAANATWSGTSDSFWDRDANWGGVERPHYNDTATFNGPGNSNTSIYFNKKDNPQALAIKDVVFTGPECAAYTIGDDSGGQTFWFMNDGSLTIDADVVNNQTIGVTARFGNKTHKNTTITLNNKSPVAKLIFNGPNAFGPITEDKTPWVKLQFEGLGDTIFNKPLSTNGVLPFLLYNDNTGTITLAGAGENRINSLNTMRANASPGNTRVVLDSGVELFVDYGTNNYSIWHEGDGVIEGAGTLRFSSGVDDNFARVYVETSSKLTIRTPLTSEAGLEKYNTYSGHGTLVLDCINTMASNLVNSSSGPISVARIGNRGSTDSNVGRGQCIRLSGNGSGLIYTGVGETTDRRFELSANASLDQSGSGDLILSQDLLVTEDNTTLTLTGSTEGAGEIAGLSGPGGETISLVKDGSGLWRITAANSYVGSTTIKNGTLALTGADGAITASSEIKLEGGALRLENNVDSNNVDRLDDAIPLTLNNSTLEFVHSGGATNYSETLGTLSIGEGNNTISASPTAEGHSSTLTFASLTRLGDSTINFTGAELGADNNRILFTTPPALVNGYFGIWATVNGTELAMYDETLGVIPGPSTNIAARGPDSVIPDDGGLNELGVHITTPGTEGAIVLEGADGSSIYSLNQMTDTPAVVSTASKTLSVCSVMIDQNAGALNIGENAGDGTLKTGLGYDELRLVNLSTNALTVNAAIADNVSATTLTKTGPGALILNGLVNVTGEATVQAGALTFGNVADQTHQLSSLVVSGGAETPTILNIDGPTEIIDSGNIAHAAMPGDRCVMNITSNLTLQGTEVTNGRLECGAGFNRAGAVIQKSGAVSVSSGRKSTAYLTIGDKDGYGYYRMTGGSCISGEMAIGGNSSFSDGNVSIFDLYGGELSVDNWCLLISWARGIGALNIFGGSFSGEDTGGEVLLTYNTGSSCVAHINLLGPEAKMFDRGSAIKKRINLARGLNNTLGALNLNNGELTLYSAYAQDKNGDINDTTTSHFNFNGGLLIAATDSPELMQGLTAAHVAPGGARIDTAGYEITINQPLVAPLGYGVSDIAFVPGGAGYIGAPAVLITGGSGIGATAIALVDLEAESQSCGQVTNILVTSAGSGYGASDNLVATLLGGGYLTPATAGAVTLSANTSGSLTKTGAGTLTLGGGGTYGGATVVSNGTLLINGAHTGGGDYTFISGTTLGGTGTVELASGTVELQAGATLAVVPTSEDGDRLTVSSLTLSDNLVAVTDIDLLDKTVRYPILTCTGNISGKLAPHIADSSWGVKLIGDTFYLRYNAGTLILIR